MFNKSFYNTCCLCNKVIKSGELLSMDNKIFCNIACAKIYHDNVENIDINIKDYNEKYNNNMLSNKDKSMYECLSHTLFNMLPICTLSTKEFNDETLLNDIKNNYIEILIKLNKLYYGVK